VTSVAADTAYPEVTPGARVRIVDFIPYLAGQGVDLSFRPTMTSAEYNLVTSGASPARKARVLAGAATRLVRNRSAAPNALSLIHRLRFLLPLPGIDPPRRLDVYDFDDALFVGSIGSENSSFGWIKREAERWHAYSSRARLVIAGNNHLAARASTIAKRVEVVPSCVDPSIQPVREHGEREVVRVGWIGSRSTAVYLERCLPVLEKMNRDKKRVELVLVGAGRSFEAPWITSLPWTPESEKELLASFDIGIMPLPDDEWTRGKCGYKLLQYFAAGVPAVASPVGVNTAMVGNERGALATSEAEWLSALELLVSDARVRKEMGSNARSFVEARYSYQHWAPQLAEMLKSLD
jgi:glycosyltransferase involved in cell wall biosynthesis